MAAVIEDEYVCAVCGACAVGLDYDEYFQPPPGWFVNAFSFEGSGRTPPEAGVRFYCRWECVYRAKNGAALAPPARALME